jgi:hypothetical protein
MNLSFFLSINLFFNKKTMDSELRHRDTNTTAVVEDDTSSDTLSLNDEYNGDLKKDMRYSYGKTPDGKGNINKKKKKAQTFFEQVTKPKHRFVFSFSSSSDA